MKLKPFILIILVSCWLVIILTIFAIDSSVTKISLEGIWMQKGFGRIMNIENGQVVIYSSTEGYCNQLTSGTFDEHFRIVDENENELVINYGSPRNYYFTRLDELPAHCSSRIENQNFAPLHNFIVLWSFFNDNYAFFDIRGIDWDQAKTDYLPRVAQVQSQQEFYLIVKELMDSLDDGHVKLNVPDSINQQMDSAPIDFERIKNEIPEAILSTYVDTPETYNYGTVSWGKLRKTNIGYIVVPRWFGFPNYRLSQQGFNDMLNNVFSADPGPGYQYYSDEKKGVDFVMNEIYADLSEVDSIIIDLRFNEGGLSGTSLQFLSHFINRDYKAAVKTIRTNTAVPVRQEIFIQPAKENVFGQNVSLLTSHWSASASEMFALSAMPSENFSRYGSETAGILSEIVYAVLPNGWEVSMSVDVVTDDDGTIYEVSGIPVDHPMNYAEDETIFYNSFFSGEQFSDPLIEKFIN